MSCSGPPAGIEYQSVAGSTHDCVAAVERLLLIGSGLRRALILTCGGDHALLLETALGDPVAIKSSFASGYGGTGPKSLSRVLQFLQSHGAELDEVLVDRACLTRLDASALTSADLTAIQSGHPVRPARWADYVSETDASAALSGALWRRMPTVMPFAILDQRLVGLALQFETDPDRALGLGYRLLEESVRERTGIAEVGSKLFSAAFLGQNPPLCWAVDDNETKGRATLFTAIFMAYRNPRAHSVSPPGDPLSEFLLLNPLFLLEADATMATSA